MSARSGADARALDSELCGDRLQRSTSARFTVRGGDGAGPTHRSTVTPDHQHGAMPRSTPDERVAHRAARHHGLVTRAAALACGLTDRQIGTRVRTGRWEAIGLGVYRIAGVPPTVVATTYGAVLLAGDGALACGPSALGLFGVGAPPSVPTICVPPSASARTPGARVRRSPVARQDRTRVGPVPTTTPARALLEVAAFVSPVRLAELVDDVLDRGLARPATVVGVIRRSLLGKGRAGVQSLREALEPWVEGVMPGSPAEARLLRKLTDGGVRPPIKQHPVRLPDGREVYLDLAWPRSLVGLEYDGRRWHNPRRLGADMLREDALRAMGWWIDRVDRPPNVTTSPRRATACSKRSVHAWRARWPPDLGWGTCADRPSM